uniref:Ankyrin n=1 Tax=Globodera rostochiensis TaxID=31243 RepID=A0A914IEY1_GLORO
MTVVDPSTSTASQDDQHQHGQMDDQQEQQQSAEQQPPQKPAKVNDQNAVFLRAARAGSLDQVLEFLRGGIDINASNSNGLNALHLASKEGHNEVVRELLRRGASVDASTKKGNTALHIAALAGQDIVVTILVEHGANVNAQSVNGFTPLYMAAQENHEVVVRYLLTHGSNQALATEDGFTPLAVALQQGHDRIVALLLENDNTSKVRLPALHIAAKKDDTRAATLLLQNEQNPNVTSKSGFTPLHIAAHYGNENIAQLLIEKGANVNFQARHNISPLHVAAKWGRTKLVELLLDRGAIIDCRTRDLLTPLHCAARSGHDAVVELLLERGAPISAKTKNGLAPLHMAAQGDHVDCARILLYNRANVDEVTVDYLTALHVAAHCGHVGVAKLLLDRHADPNARALNGFTPLHIACKKNRIKVVELLLKYHASVEATTESGLAPLHVAAFMGCINIVIFLIQQGANVDCETVRGETPLHLAARANQTDIVRVLVRNKANVDAQARELQTPLHIAARLGNADIVMILLSAHANPNAATRDQYTPLHIAAKEGQEEVVQLLLEKKSNKTLLTKKGFSPLHLAAKYGNYAVVRLLLERGTPVDIEGKNQVTPLHVATHYNNERVAQLLLERGARAQACAKNGYTPLHIAAKKNQMEIAHALLAYRADPNAESRAGFTPLHLASEEGHLQMAGLLTENGSQVNARAKNGLTPMHLCAQEDCVQVADHLFDNGADINAQTNAGYTPLHVACHFGQMNMVRWLVSHGANVNAETRSNYTPLHQAAQQGHNHVVQYLLANGASPNTKTACGQTPLAIAQRLGYVSVVETLRTVTETTVITETTTITEERYRPQNPEAMNETMFSDSEDEADDHQAAAAEHARDFNESITQGLRDSAVVHLIHTGEQGGKSSSMAFDSTDADLEAVIKRAQNAPVTTAMADSSFLDNGHDDNVALSRHDLIQPSFLISFLVDARGGAMRGCRHSGVRVIIPPRKAAAPIRITCRYLKKEKLTNPPPLSEGEALASRVLEMGPHGAKFLGPVILEVPHFASLRGREREIVILRSDDSQHWKEHQLEATEDAVQEVLNESFDAQELQQLDELHTSRITRILTNDFPMYFAVVTRVRQEVHCVGPEGGVILSSVVPRVQAIFPDGSLTKTIKVSLQAQPVPQEIVSKLHGNRVAVSPIVTVEPRRRKFHKPITLCIPLPQSTQKGMLTQYPQQQQQQQQAESSGKGGTSAVKEAAQQQAQAPQTEPPTLRLLCSITGGSAPAQWEDITGTTQLTFTGDEISFTTTVSARFWLMDCQTPRDAAHMAQEVYNEAIAVPYMAKFAVFARRPYPVEGQLRMFCMTDDKEDKTLEKQEGFVEIAKSRDVEVLNNRHQWLEFAGNLVPVTKRGDQLSVFFMPFQESRLMFNAKIRQQDDQEAGAAGRIAVMKEPRVRADTLPPQHPICTLSITLPDYTGPLPSIIVQANQQRDKQQPSNAQQLTSVSVRYGDALQANPAEAYPNVPVELVAKHIGGDWARLARVLGLHPEDIRQIRKEFNSASGHEPMAALKIWIWLKGVEEANASDLEKALRQIGRDDIVHRMYGLDMTGTASDIDDTWRTSRGGTPIVAASLRRDHSSKGSLAATTGGLAFAAAPTAAVALSQALSATPPSSTAGISPIPSGTTAAEPDGQQQQESNVETVVTRTERYVHNAENGHAPVVDERVTEHLYRDGQEVQRNEVERHGLPLTDKEHEQWETLATADTDAVADQHLERAARSREAMVIDGQPQQLVTRDEHGRPVGTTTVQTTTFVTEHVLPREEEEEEDVEAEQHVQPVQVPAEQEEHLIEEEQREPSQGSEEGSVVIHDEQQQHQDVVHLHHPQAVEEQHVVVAEPDHYRVEQHFEEEQQQQQQQAEQKSGTTVTTTTTVTESWSSNRIEEEEQEHAGEQHHAEHPVPDEEWMMTGYKAETEGEGTNGGGDGGTPVPDHDGHDGGHHAHHESEPY